MALDKKPGGDPNAVLQFDTERGTIVLTAVQRQTPANGLAAVPQDKKEER